MEKESTDSDNVVSLDAFRQRVVSAEEDYLEQEALQELQPDQIDSLLSHLDELLSSIKDPAEPDIHHYYALHSLLSATIDMKTRLQDSTVAGYDDEVKHELFLAKDALYKVDQLILPRVPKDT